MTSRVPMAERKITSRGVVWEIIHQKTERRSSNDDRRKRDHQNQLQHQSGMASALPKSVEHHGNQAPQQWPDQEYPRVRKFFEEHSQRNKGSQPQRQPDDGQGNGQKKRADPGFLKLQNQFLPEICQGNKTHAEYAH